MEERQCLRILEIPEDASMEDITQAYQMMKRIYEKEESVFTAPSMDEFSPEAREGILAAIEAAYHELVRIHAGSRPQFQPPPVAPPPGDLPLDGKALRRFRENLGVSLGHVAAQTHVRVEHLRALEDERYSELPPAAVNVRGFLTAYVSELGLPADDIVPPYMRRFQAWRARRGK